MASASGPNFSKSFAGSSGYWPPGGAADLVRAWGAGGAESLAVRRSITASRVEGEGKGFRSMVANTALTPEGPHHVQ